MVQATHRLRPVLRTTCSYRNSYYAGIELGNIEVAALNSVADS
jgi:hypothetical protein